MDGATLIELLKSFMDDEEISEPFAYQLLNMAKDNIEMRRPWMKLRNFKSDYSFASSDGKDNFKDLPDNFLMTYGDKPLKLISGSEVVYCVETPMEARDENDGDIGKFYIKHYDNTFAILGGITKNYTGTLYYIASSDDIEEATEWIFPKMAHPLLVIEALIIHRGEVDFDNINARMVDNGYSTKDAMEQSLTMWDAQLQTRARRGQAKGDLFSKTIN